MSYLSVVGSLAQITREMRQEGKINRTRVAALQNKSEDTVRTFEKGKVAPHVDAMVNAVAADAGISPVDLWTAAITRAALQAGAPGEKVRFATELGDAAAGALGAPGESNADEPAPRDAEDQPPK